jgi:hypothetical protein
MFLFLNNDYYSSYIKPIIHLVGKDMVITIMQKFKIFPLSASCEHVRGGKKPGKEEKKNMKQE